MVSILSFWLFLSNSTLPVTPTKFLVAARPSRIDCASLAAALDHVGDQHDLIVGMGVEVRRILALYFALKASTKSRTSARLSVGSNCTMRT